MIKAAFYTGPEGGYSSTVGSTVHHNNIKCRD